MLKDLLFCGILYKIKFMPEGIAMVDAMVDKEKIINTLGRDDKDKYYVYMLCDNKNRPFYIGKGEGGRCLERDVRGLLQEISGIKEGVGRGI